jgi:hypothetical protein
VSATTGADLKSATVSWTAPQNHGDAAIDGYDVQVVDLGLFTDGSGQAAPVVQHFDSTATTQTITGLTEGHRYQFLVRATNGSDGDYSDPTDAANSNDAATMAKLPDSPTGLKATAGDGQVALSWTAPGDSGLPLNNYFIYRGTTTGGPYTLISTCPDNCPKTPTYTDATAANGTTYYYVVTAENPLGESKDSVEVSATPAAAPGGGGTVGAGGGSTGTGGVGGGSGGGATPTPTPTTTASPTPAPTGTPTPSPSTPSAAPLPAWMPAGAYTDPTSVLTTDGQPSQIHIGDAVLDIPAGALPAGTVVSLYGSSASDSAGLLPPGDGYVAGFAVAWLAPDGTSPDADQALTLTITDSAIQPGQTVYLLTSDGLRAAGPPDERTTIGAGKAVIRFAADPGFLLTRPTAPGLRSVGMSRHTMRVGPQAPGLVTRHHREGGTVLRFVANRAETVRLVFQRRVAGELVRAGVLVIHAHQGLNRLYFDGELPRAHHRHELQALPAGRYRILLSAHAGGLTSTVRHVQLRLLG